ncbi:hypothetical protein [Burkholderia anthina]|uniref:hypothetical protein n=1 Tax=Burkholderia anthina TaxID=179879 RepID=UPI00158C1542|nr:hypothetical protein [Burkholderia anthina]
MATELISRELALDRINKILQSTESAGHDKAGFVLEFVDRAGIFDGLAPASDAVLFSGENAREALSAIFGVWDRLGVHYDLKKVVDVLTSSALLADLEDAATTAIGKTDPVYLRFSHWHALYQRVSRPGDQVRGLIDTLKVRSALGPYYEAFESIVGATGDKPPQGKVSPASPSAPAVPKTDAPKNQMSKQKKLVVAVLVLGVAAAWTHKVWTDRAVSDAPRAATHAE